LQIEWLESRVLLSAAQADANGDGVVDTRDFNAISLHFGVHHSPPSKANGDFNADGVVNALDFNILASLFGEHDLMAIAKVQSTSISSDAASTSARTKTFSTTPTVGNFAYLIVVVKAAAGTPGVPTVTDNYNNYWTQVLSVANIAAHVRMCVFAARVSTTGASFTVTITPSASQKMFYSLSEFSGYGVNALPAIGAAAIKTGTGTTATTNAMSVVSGATAITLGVVVNTGTAATITPTETEFAEDESVTNIAANASYSTGVTATAPTMSWTLGSSQSWLAAGVAIYPAEFPTTPSNTSALPAPTLSLDARDITWASGRGFNSTYAVNLLAGAALNYSGAIGTIIVCAAVPASTQLLYADESTLSGVGGYSLITGAGVDISGQIGTDQSESNGDGGISGTNATNPSIPTVYALTIDSTAKTYEVRSNGFSVASGSFAGTPLSALGLYLFGAVAGGATVNTGNASLYGVRVYSTPQTAAIIDAAAREMAWPAGDPVSKRYADVSFDNATDVMILGQTSDGTTFESFRKVGYAPVLGDVRDVDVWYDASSATYYAAHTCYNFSNFGDKFLIAKAKDLRLWLPHATVDVSDVITAASQNPWAPQFYPHNQTPTSILFHNGQDSTKVYRKPITSLSAGTFGSSVRLTGASGSDAFIQPPGVVGNPSGKYRFWGGPDIGYRDSDALDGAYGSKTAIDTTGNGNEAPFIDVINGQLRAYGCGNNGTVYWTSNDNGATWSDSANPTATTGTLIASGGAYDTGQFALLEVNPPEARRLSLGLGLGL
jgi:hypothetical protein